MPGHSLKPTSLCGLAATLPLLIGHLLDQEAKLSRGRFREETLTDIFTGALAACAGPELVIQYPVEVVTGADLDLRFWNVAGGQELNLRIQAKRLEAKFDGKKRVNVRCRSYRSLLYRPVNSTAYQFQTLVNAASKPGSVPLYMFYNHQSVVTDDHFKTPGPPVSGVNLAFATDIEKEMQSKLRAKKPRSKPHMRLSHLRKHMFRLESILCPGGDWKGANVPTPQLVRDSLDVPWNQKGDGYARTEEDGADVARKLMSELLSQPRSVADLSSARRVRDGLPVRIDPAVKRPRITFISGRTADSGTPTISTDFQE